MNLLQDLVEIQCPYCGELVQIVADCSVSDQEYIEDCAVCCKPINLKVLVNEEGMPIVTAWSQDEC